MPSVKPIHRNDEVQPFSALEMKAPPDGSRGFLFLDYDGTLAPIVSWPERAAIPPRIRRALERAVAHPGWKVGIVSGRRLDDVRRRVGIQNLIYAGNHGFEIQFPSQPRFIHPAAKIAKPIIDAIHRRVKKETATLPGVLVENKIYTLSLHTRLADVTSERRAHLALMHAARQAIRRKEVVIRRGKKVLEVRPAIRWDKGRAVRAIMESVPPPVFSVYVGDDNTDEDAFRALRNDGVTIRVGHGETNARFFISSVDEMPKTLDAVIDLLPSKA